MLTRRSRGQATVEFALVSIIFLGLLFATIDLAHAGLLQHQLDAGAGELAHGLATLSGTNSNPDPTTFSLTPLNPASAATTIYLAQTVPVSQAMQTALTRAAAVSGGLLSTAPLTMTAPMTLSNGQVTVVATPDLTNTSDLTVTVTTAFTPLSGVFLGGRVFHLSTSESAVPTPHING
jgi:Flp pilus assembly protein TadG